MVTWYDIRITAPEKMHEAPDTTYTVELKHQNGLVSSVELPSWQEVCQRVGGWFDIIRDSGGAADVWLENVDVDFARETINAPEECISLNQV